MSLGCSRICDGVKKFNRMSDTTSPFVTLHRSVGASFAKCLHIRLSYVVRAFLSSVGCNERVLFLSSLCVVGRHASQNSEMRPRKQCYTNLADLFARHPSSFPDSKSAGAAPFRLFVGDTRITVLQ